MARRRAGSRPDAPAQPKQNRELADALASLGETSPLLVRNMAFCTQVLSFGSIKRFDKNEFCRDQEVLLYAEIENFTSESTEKGFHTSLGSSYQILDSLGRPVFTREFASTDDLSKIARHDFFIAYHFRVPMQLTPGKYTLRLAIRDKKSQKTGQGSIEFTVKEGKAEPAKAKGGK